MQLQFVYFCAHPAVSHDYADCAVELPAQPVFSVYNPQHFKTKRFVVSLLLCGESPKRNYSALFYGWRKSTDENTVNYAVFYATLYAPLHAALYSVLYFVLYRS